MCAVGPGLNRDVEVAGGNFDSVAALVYGLALFVNLATFQRHGLAAYPASTSEIFRCCHVGLLCLFRENNQIAQEAECFFGEMFRLAVTQSRQDCSLGPKTQAL